MPNFINSKEKIAKSFYYVISKGRMSGIDGLNKYSKGPITNGELDVADISQDVCQDLSELFTFGRSGLLVEVSNILASSGWGLL